MPTLATTLIKLYPPVLPVGYCYPSTSPQQLANDFFNNAIAEFRSDIGNSFFNFGGTVPDAENRGFPWLRTDGGDIDDWYVFSHSAWLAPFRWLYGDSNDRLLWIGNAANISTKDGGEAGVATPVSGPFWEIDTAFDGRSPMGPGTVPNAVPAKVLAVTEAYGSGSYLQKETDVASHSHAFGAPDEIIHNNNVHTVNTGSGSTVGLFIGESGDANADLSVAPSDSGGVDQTASPIVHPVVGIYFLKRTIRLFRRIDV